MSVGKLRASQFQPKGQWITAVRRFAIYLRDHFMCLYCGTDLHEVEPYQISLDHLLPRSRGGTNQSSNLVTACRSCNSARRDTPWRQYATGGAIERIVRHRRRVVNIALARSAISGIGPDPRLEDMR